MIGRSVLFQIDNCRMTLYLPEAIEKMTITNLRKILKLASQDRRNDDSIQFFFTCLPDLLSELKQDWVDASYIFQKFYLDPVYKDGIQIRDSKERKKRKEHKKRLFDQVKNTKRRYERIEKKIQKLEMHKQLYLY